jgi:hypothetical protein
MELYVVSNVSRGMAENLFSPRYEIPFYHRTGNSALFMAFQAPFGAFVQNE